MNKYFFFFLLFCSAIAGCKNTENAIEEPKGQPVVTLGDPFILLHNDIYYAYGTNADEGIEVYTSPDLATWEKQSKLALHKDDTWADRWFWAPEVYLVNGKFYMYFSADEHISVAVADAPEGPFRQTEKKPMLEGEKSIDNSLFIDEDGKPYLYFDRFNDGLNIWVAELEDDLQTLKENTLTKCIHVSQTWEEVWPRVNEGPYVLKHKGIYYMTYSANSYESPFYGIGYATADSPMGPWTKYDKNPIYQKPDTLVGIGHGALFTDKAGKLRITFHAHHNQQHTHPRNMNIADVTFTEDEKPIMQITGKIVRPTLKITE